MTIKEMELYNALVDLCTAAGHLHQSLLHLCIRGEATFTELTAIAVSCSALNSACQELCNKMKEPKQ